MNSIFKLNHVNGHMASNRPFLTYFTPPPLFLPPISSSCQCPFLTRRVLTLANKFGGRLSLQVTSGMIEPASCEPTQATGRQVAKQGKRGKAL